MPGLVMDLVNRFTGGGEGKVHAGADAQRNQLFSQGNPEYLEVRRRGQGYQVQTAALFAPLIAIPTTVAALEVFNNGERVMVVSDLHAAQINAVAEDETYGLFACMTTLKAAPTLTTLDITSLTGKPLFATTIVSEVITGIGTTIIANGWVPYGVVQSWGVATGTPGPSWSVPIDGKLVIPPKASLCLHVMGPNATSTSFNVGVSFDFMDAEVEE